MVQKYSNKTIDAVAHFIESYYTGTHMSSLFLFTSVPKDLDHGSNKLERALNVLTGLVSGQVPNSSEILDNLISEAITRRKNIFTSGYSSHETCERLVQALRADGYDIQGGKIVELEALEDLVTDEISLIEQRLNSFAMADVANHLDQAHQNYIDRRYESSNAMLRAALEGTIKNIAISIAGGEANIPRANPRYLSPSDCRKYLQQQNFFEQDELNLINQYYGYASQDGSHPGISSEPECRLRRLMTVALLQYCLEKLIEQRRTT